MKSARARNANQSEIIRKVYEAKVQLETERKVNANTAAVNGSSAKAVAAEDDGAEENDLAFLFLESELERRNLVTLDQLPLRGVKDVVDLANSLPASEQVFSVLQKMQATEKLGFPISETAVSKIKLAAFQPRFYCPYLTGTGYYAPGDQLTHRVAALELGYELYPTLIGFALPDQLTCDRVGQIFNTFKMYRSSADYQKARHEDLRLPAGLIGGGSSSSGGSGKQTVQWETKHGHNISHKKQYADIAFTFAREYRQFSLSLRNSSLNPQKEKPQLSLAFLNRVKEICTYQIEDYFGEKQWQHFFTFHGTHVVVKACGGGKLVLTVSETQLKQYFRTDNLIKKQEEVEQMFCDYLDLNDANYDKMSSDTSKPPDPSKPGEAQNPFETLFIHSIKLHGGDPMYEGMDLIKSTKNRSDMRQVLQDWIQSLSYSPIMLEETMIIESIPEVLERYGLMSEAYIIDAAAKRLFGKSLRSRMGVTRRRHSSGLLRGEPSDTRRNSNYSLPLPL